MTDQYAWKYENDSGTVYLSLSAGFIEHLEKIGRLKDGVDVSIVTWGEQ